MTRLILATRAWELMEEDCLEHRATETGGLLVGKRINSRTRVPWG